MQQLTDREYFLLQNAKEGNDCKQFYAEYLQLEVKNLVVWQIGHAWLTIKGDEVLDKYETQWRVKTEQ